MRILLLGLPVLMAFGSPALAEALEIEKLVARKAAIIEMMHRKARMALVTAAQDRAYGDYFHHRHSDAERHAIKGRIDQISLQVQRRFRVEEMCLINPEGAEVSRIVGDEIAHDLSLEEASAIFFAPGFAQAPRQVYTSPIYMSPDARKWVIAYVTPVVNDDEKRAILHYEIDLAAYQAALDEGFGDGERVILAVDEDGSVISDSRITITLEQQGGSAAAEDYFEPFRLGLLTLAELRAALGGNEREGAGRIVADDGAYEVAYRVAGRWTILVVEPS